MSGHNIFPNGWPFSLRQNYTWYHHAFIALCNSLTRSCTCICSICDCIPCAIKVKVTLHLWWKLWRNRSCLFQANGFLASSFWLSVCGILLNSETIDLFFHISTIVCQAKSIDVMCWKKPSSDPTACKPHQVHESWAEGVEFLLDCKGVLISGRWWQKSMRMLWLVYLLLWIPRCCFLKEACYDQTIPFSSFSFCMSTITN